MLRVRNADLRAGLRRALGPRSPAAARQLAPPPDHGGRRPAGPHVVLTIPLAFYAWRQKEEAEYQAREAAVQRDEAIRRGQIAEESFNKRARISSRREKVAEELKTSNPAPVEAIGSLVADGRRKRCGRTGPRCRAPDAAAAEPSRTAAARGSDPGAETRAHAARPDAARPHATSGAQRGPTGDSPRARCVPDGVCGRGPEGAAGSAGAHSRAAESHGGGVRTRPTPGANRSGRPSACPRTGSAPSSTPACFGVWSAPA